MLAAEAAATGSLPQPPEMSFDSETPGGQFNVVKFALYISNAIQVVWMNYSITRSRYVGEYE